MWYTITGQFFNILLTARSTCSPILFNLLSQVLENVRIFVHKFLRPFIPFRWSSLEIKYQNDYLNNCIYVNRLECIFHSKFQPMCKTPNRNKSGRLSLDISRYSSTFSKVDTGSTSAKPHVLVSSLGFQIKQKHWPLPTRYQMPFYLGLPINLKTA